MQQLPETALPQSKGAISLRWGSVWLVIATAVYGLCQWGILIALTRMSEDPQTVGHYSISYAIVLPITLLCNLQLRSIQASDARHRFRFTHYMLLRILTLPLAILMTVLATWYWTHSSHIVFIALLLALAKSFDGISDVFHGLFLQTQHTHAMAISLMARGMLGIAALACVFNLSGELAPAMIAFAIAMAFVLFVFDMLWGLWLRNKSLYTTKINESTGLPGGVKLLFHQAWPLGMAVLLMAVVMQLPQLAVERWLDTRTLGLFAPMHFIILAASMLITALCEASTPRMAQYLAHHQLNHFKKTLFRLLAAAGISGGLLTSVALTIGPQLLQLLYGSDYAMHGYIFAWLCIAGAFAFVANVLTYAIIAANGYRSFFLPYLFIATMSVAFYAWATPKYELVGTAFSFILTNILACIILTMILVVHLKRITTGSGTSRHTTTMPAEG